jgi:hypothetical protein
MLELGEDEGTGFMILLEKAVHLRAAVNGKQS